MQGNRIISHQKNCLSIEKKNSTVRVMKKSQTGDISLIAVAVLVTIITITSIITSSLIKQNKPNSKIQTISHQPQLIFSSTSLSAGQPFDLIIKVNPNGSTFNAFRFDYSFDGSKVEFLNLSDISSHFERLFTSSLPLDTQISGTTVSILGAKTGTSFSGITDIDMVKVKMRVKSGVTGTVAFNWNSTTEVEDKTFTSQNANFTIK